MIVTQAVVNSTKVILNCPRMRGRKVKAKGQFYPPSKPWIHTGVEIISSYIPPRHYMELTQLQAPASLLSRKIQSSTRWIRGSVGPRTGGDVMKKVKNLLPLPELQPRIVQTGEGARWNRNCGPRAEVHRRLEMYASLSCLRRTRY